MGAVRKIKLFLNQSKQVSANLKKEKGKNKLSTLVDLAYCSYKYKTSPHNYEVMGFADLTKDQRKTFFTFADNIAMMEKYNSKKHEAIFYNKFIFSKVFSDFYGRKCIMTNYLTEEDFVKFMEGETKIVYKPVNGAKGESIYIFDVKDFNSLSELYKKIKSLPNAILETWIVQHHELDRIYPHSVNCIRIKTVLDKDICHILEAKISFGHNSEIANDSINSLFSKIDVKTGKIITDACNYPGEVFETHPETGVKFNGIQIPFWKETLEMIDKASKVMYQVKYVGWDIAITEDGPILIEGNNDPGYTGFQYPMFTQGHGGKDLYAEFLK